MYLLRRALCLILVLSCLPVFAKEMVAGSEQYYVTQGLFINLNITTTACDIEDDIVNFACGWFSSSAQLFQESVNQHVSQELPGLSPLGEWFNNAGTLVRSYKSASGTYLFAYNSDGYIVIAFTPN